MLSPDARKALAEAKAQGGAISFSDLAKAKNWSLQKSRIACKQLVDQGFAEWKYDAPVSGKPAISGILLSEKGLYSGLFFWSEIGKFLFKSVVVPIIVAFITALITAIITVRVTQG